MSPARTQAAFLLLVACAGAAAAAAGVSVAPAPAPSSSTSDAPEPAPQPFSGGFTQLHGIALAGFLATLGAGALVHALRRASFAAESAVQRSTLAHLLPRRLVAALPSWVASASAAEAALLLGYALTASYYLAAAQADDPAPGRTAGRLIAPTLGLLLLPMTRNSLWLPLLGVPFERAVKVHQVTAVLLLGLVIAHAVLVVQDDGLAVLTYRVANGLGDGTVYGTAAATLLAAQVALASPPVRRASWELFKGAHHVLFPAIIVLAVVHARLVLPYVVLPLALWD